MNSLIFKKSNSSDATVVRGSSVPYISFKALENSGLVLNGFSTRLGGVSEGYLSSLNLGFGRGESDENVLENFRRIGESIGFDYRKLVAAQQTHTTNLRLVGTEDAGKGIVRPRDYENIDGLVTDVPGLPLVTFFADCVPLYFLDPVKKAIGLSHSGWRGTAGKIGAKTVRFMQEKFGSRAEDIIACIGPSICRDCYEVSTDVAEEFIKAFDIKEELQNHPDNIKGKILYRKDNGKFLLDLRNACRAGLLEAGLRNENIHNADICTCCNRELLYSHRGSNGKRGSLAAFLMLKE